MTRSSAIISSLVLVVFLNSSCGFTHSKSDVQRYLGKTEDEIAGILGTPTGWCGRPANVEAEDATADTPLPPRRIMYRLETATLPEPFTGMDFIMSDNGVCREVAGYTTGFSSPEDLLAAVGLSGSALVPEDEDDTGIRYEAPDFSLVEVYKPSRVADRYSDFLVAG